MSDTIQLALPSNAPAFLSRLRAGRFTSPSGVESSFLFDDLSRTRGKKTSQHDIADSDVSILQDLGSALQSFSMSVYFVGDNCDIDADKFYASLFERYTPDKPGVLNHPRWGDINVLPFGSPEQTESFTSAAGVSRIAVEFRETASISTVQSSVLSAGEIEDTASIAKENALTRAKSIATIGAKAYSKFRAIVKNKVFMIKSAIDSVVTLSDDIRAEVEAINQGILDALTVGATPAIVLGQVNAMIETVASIPQDTADLANAILNMTNDVIASFGDDITNATTSEDVKNAGYTYQSIATACVSGYVSSAIAIDYTTRDQAGSSIDNLVDIAASYSAGMNTAANRISGDVTKSFSPDSDIERGVYDAIRDAIGLLLSRAFSLKSRRLYVIDHPSDPLTETWTHYGTMDDLEFFCATNKIIGNEFIELPAGRTLVFYE